jgi:hypothetical protein
MRNPWNTFSMVKIYWNTMLASSMVKNPNIHVNPEKSNKYQAITSASKLEKIML